MEKETENKAIPFTDIPAKYLDGILYFSIAKSAVIKCRSTTLYEL